MAIRTPFGGGSSGNPSEPVRFEDLWQDREFVRAFSLRVVGDAHMTEDVVQETYLQAFRSLEKLDERSSFIPWLATVARCRAINEVKKHAKVKPVDDLPDAVDGDCADPAESAEQRETLALVRGALDRLTHRERRLLIRQVEEGLSMQQLADAEDSTVASVKSVLMRARSKLRRVLEDAGAWVLAPIVAFGNWVRRHTHDAALRVQQAAPTMQIGYERVGEMATAAVVALVLVGPATPATSDAPADVHLDQAASAVAGHPAATPESVAIPTTGVRVDEAAETDPGPVRVAGTSVAGDGVDDGSGDEDSGVPRFPLSPDQPAPHTPPSPPPPDPDNPTYDDDAEEPEDAHFTDFAYAPRSDAGGDAASEGGGPVTVFALGANMGQCVSGPCTLLFTSTNSGATWEKLPAAGLDADQLLLPPNYPDDPRIFAMGQGGLQVSTDGGHSFKALSKMPHRGPAVMATGWADGDHRIFVGARPPWAYDADRDEAFPLAAAGWVAERSPLALPTDAGAGAQLFAGQRDAAGQSVVYRCADQACAEQTTLAGSLGVPDVAVTNPNGGQQVVFAWRQDRLYRSVDDGQSFARVESFPAGLDITQVVDEAGLLYLTAISAGDAAPRVGLLVSSDGGQTWEERGSRTPVAAGIKRVVVTPDGTVIVARSGAGGGGVFCSRDRGLTWAPRCGPS